MKLSESLESLGSNQERLLEQEKKTKHRLLKTLWKLFLRPNLFILLGNLIASGCRIAVAIVMGLFIAYFEGSERDDLTGYSLAIAIIGFYVVICLLYSQIFYYNMRIGLHAKNLLAVVIFQKLLKLDISSPYTSGKVVNMMENDCCKIQEFSIFFWYLIVAPLEFFVSIYFIIDRIGVIPSLAGIISVFFFFFIQFILSRKSAAFRQKSLADLEIVNNSLTEIIYGIVTIKYNAWERIFGKSVCEERDKRNKHLMVGGFIKAINDTFFVISPSTSFINCNSFHIRSNCDCNIFYWRTA